MNKNFLIAVLCLFLITAIFVSNLFFQTSANIVDASNINISAKSSCVIDASSKRVLLDNNKDDQLPMASTTKIMTALIAIENCKDLDEVFATDNRAVGLEGTSIYLKKDEHLSMRELLYGLMLASGNDASMAIAYKIGNGNVDTFVDLMNKKVEELNLHNTHFDNPHGLDSKTHYTSAYDLAIITAKAMENETFREIVKTDIKQITSVEEAGNRFLRNKHKLLKTLKGCEGVKTGFTDNARRCCVTSVTRDNMRLICVVLNCNDMFEESRKVLEDCFETYKNIEILPPNNFVKAVSVTNGATDFVKTYTKENFSYPLLATEIDKLEIKVVLPESVEPVIKKNSEIGEYKIYLNNNLIFNTKIYIMEDVNQQNYEQNVKDIIEKWFYD